MTITELAILVLKPDNVLPSPTLTPLFALLASRQSAWSGHPLRFYHNTSDTSSSEIYLISGWTDVAAHQEWIASAANQDLLTMFAPYLDVKDLVHLDVEFERVPDRDPLRLEVGSGEHGDGDGVFARDAEGKRDGWWWIAPLDSTTSTEGAIVLKRVEGL